MNALLMDTHVWLWFALKQSKRMPKSIIKTIDKAAKEGMLTVSIFSIWEIGLLVSKNKLQFGMPVNEWINKALDLQGLRLAPLDTKIVLDCHNLPGEFHQDPADRLLVATARQLDAVLLTADQQILDYGASGYVRVLQV